MAVLAEFHLVEHWFLQSRQAGDLEKALDIARAAKPCYPRHRVITTFWIASVLAELGDTQAAIATLGEGSKEGLWWSERLLLSSPGLRGARSYEDFRRIIIHCAAMRLEEERRSRSPEVRVMRPSSSREGRPLIFAIHGKGRGSRRFSTHWATFLGAGMTVAVPQSTQLHAAGLYNWDDRNRALRELETAWRHVQTVEASVGRLIIVAGFSDGGPLAMLLALRETVRGSGCSFVAVAPNEQHWSADDLESETRVIRRSSCGDVCGGCVVQFWLARTTVHANGQGAKWRG